MMIVWLEELRTSKSVKLNLEVDYSIPANDLLVVFHAKNLTITLNESDSDSSPIDQFRIRKLHHIVIGKTVWKEQKYHLTLGYILINGRFSALLLDEKPEGKYSMFNNNKFDFGGFGFNDFKILNYEEYKYLKLS